MEDMPDQASPTELTVIVPRHADRQRLDHFLTEMSGLSRSQIALRYRHGDIEIDGRRPQKSGERLRSGQLVTISVPPPPPSEARPQAIPLDIVYEDEHLVILDKAADMVVHPSPGHDDGTLVNALLHRFGTLAPDLGTEDGLPRPGIVHRLDRGTSGLMVVARTAAARDGLQILIADRHVTRRYLAVVHGPRLADSGTFDTLHGRHPNDRKRFTTRVGEGKNAITHWVVLARSRSLALVECRLKTGRTHQIRVHFADDGHPLAGDTVYGGSRRLPGAEGAVIGTLTRQALHAWKLAFRHPITGAALAFRRLPPPDLLDVITRVFGEDVVESLGA